MNLKYDPVLCHAYWKFFYATVLVNHPVYAITVIFIFLLSDKASNAEFFQIFPCAFITPKLESLPIVTERTLKQSQQ